MIFDAPLAASARRFGARAAILAAAASLLTLSGCGPLASRIRTTDAPSSIRLQSLRQPANPPEYVARSADEADLLAARLTGDDGVSGRLKELREARGSRRIIGPQSPFFFESAIGRAYLATGVAGMHGRAIAQGWPADRCPAFGAALPASDTRSAAAAALKNCLNELPETADQDCGCRLLAADDVLLATPETFVYARGVAAMVYEPASGRQAVLVAEERHPRNVAEEIVETLHPESLDALAKGARRLWLLSPDRPAAALDLGSDGAAELVFVDGPRESLTPGKRLSGRWRAEGFRRGRLAGVARLEDDAGAPLIVLIGYGPGEIAERGDELLDTADSLGG